MVNLDILLVVVRDFVLAEDCLLCDAVDGALDALESGELALVVEGTQPVNTQLPPIAAPMRRS